MLICYDLPPLSFSSSYVQIYFYGSYVSLLFFCLLFARLLFSVYFLTFSFLSYSCIIHSRLLACFGLLSLSAAQLIILFVPYFIVLSSSFLQLYLGYILTSLLLFLYHHPLSLSFLLSRRRRRQRHSRFLLFTLVARCLAPLSRHAHHIASIPPRRRPNAPGPGHPIRCCPQRHVHRRHMEHRE